MCEARLPEGSLYKLLAREGGRLFGDEMFADLYGRRGRPSIPPRIVATVMVLQRLEGLSDREAVERFEYDVRWKYAAGDLDVNFPGFTHPVLVEMRARLRASARPDRIFEATVEMAKERGLVGKKRVLDSTALYDAVATQDTVTLVRSAIRALLRVASAENAAQIRASLRRDDAYDAAGKPACEWDDRDAREALVDALAKDAYAALEALRERALSEEEKSAGALVATVVGQDIEATAKGFRIVDGVAPDRVISIVDPEARHGHKTEARGFDGYKGHVAVDPDSEIITATAVTPGNVGDGSVGEALLTQELSAEGAVEEVYGDASYGTAELVEKLEGANVEANVKVQAPPARAGMYSQDAFGLDTQARTATCPAGRLVPLRLQKSGAMRATFGVACNACSQRDHCTESKAGRVLFVHPKHEVLARSRARQKSDEWRERYRSTRPKVERKIAHLVRRKHGGRRARVRGALRVGHDFAVLAGAVNLLRLARLASSGA
jgi:transposase